MKMDKKLSVFELLKRAVKLLLSNINLALIVFLCSLPLFCFLIFFELSLQTTLSFTDQFLSKQNDLFHQNTTNYLTYQSLYQQRNIWEDLSENDLIPWLIKTSLLYFFPYTILDLLTTTTIVAASSTEVVWSHLFMFFSCQPLCSFSSFPFFFCLSSVSSHIGRKS
ncbi:BnaC07g12990D [Brassica napus]|uniref:BnaC07g12990D protein n=1 Tax=Brassica napus TaxID=3708 RepID=A0A078GSG2_BRANA|nr:BnaC07g12990D [Brassica napus]